MAPRQYSLKRRAEAAQETRQRIVDATLQLHAEKGVVATSHKDIAARADVSVGTVYHHFPTQDAIVRACGVHVHQLIPPPAPDAIDRRMSRRQRVVALARALVAYYVRMPWWERLRTERDDVPALDMGMSLREEAVRKLIGHVLGRSASAKTVAVVEAIADAAVINRLFESGMSQDEAASTLASIINTWLEGGRS